MINHLSPQLVEHKKKSMTYDNGNPELAWDRQNNLAGLNFYFTVDFFTFVTY